MQYDPNNYNSPVQNMFGNIHSLKMIIIWLAVRYLRGVTAKQSYNSHEIVILH